MTELEVIGSQILILYSGRFQISRHISKRSACEKNEVGRKSIRMSFYDNNQRSI